MLVSGASGVVARGMKISGQFRVEMSGRPPYFEEDGLTLSAAGVNKHFEGALQATSTVEMLACRPQEKSSAAYVALERIVGTLDGHSGSFCCVHLGVIDRGASRLSIDIVPDSGSGELAKIRGKMAIEIKDGVHFYELDFEI